MTLSATVMANPAKVETPAVFLQFGTPGYRKAARATFFGGFATFAMLYCLQPLMPELANEFALSPAQASGAMSMATGGLALFLVPASLLADRSSRKFAMVTALALSGLLTILAAFAGSFSMLLGVRALFGIALAGLPAVAMAYLSEEIAPESLGRAMGLYIAGNASGGMSGRLIAPLLADLGSWRMATAALGVMGVAAAIAVARTLPASRHFKPQRSSLADMGRHAMRHLRDPGLPWLFVCAFLLMGAFVSYYNYLGFRLSAPPFSLPLSVQGLVFLPYIFGMFASAWAGRLADRFGRREVLWCMVCVMTCGLLVSLSGNGLILACGAILVTFGFFASHSIASSWVGRRARDHRALASALYLAAYYMGSSILGWTTGLVWHLGAWASVVAILTVVLSLCLAVALYLRHLTPIQ
ncbi:MAG: major facilitator superfamily transporter [Proteobacteria bacterium]|nr:major facilitator superfamily transporter [Pseudomonadota bacterium]